MKKLLLSALCAVLTAVILTLGMIYAVRGELWHHYTKWSLISHERGGMTWDQVRTCERCGYSEMHIESATALKPK